jgi:hypothetical protein
MNKKQIIDKIIDDLPTRDMRGEMSPDEWYGWFEEAFDKGYAEALRIHDVVGRSEQLVCDCDKWHDRMEESNNTCSTCDKPIN